MFWTPSREALVREVAEDMCLGDCYSASFDPGVSEGRGWGGGGIFDDGLESHSEGEVS